MPEGSAAPAARSISATSLILLLLLAAPAITAEVSRFVADGAGGTVTDTLTGAVWMVGPDARTCWYEGQEWVDSLGGDWRTPTLSELRMLYDTGVDTFDWGPFENDGCWVWAVEDSTGSPGWAFMFRSGIERFYDTVPTRYARAFAVSSSEAEADSL